MMRARRGGICSGVKGTGSGSMGALARRRSLLVAMFGLALLLCPGVAPAFADFGFVPGSTQAVATNRDGTPDTLAGSHPFAYTTSFKLNATTDVYGHPVTEGGNPKDVAVELPPGLIGNPGATPKCTEAEFSVVALYPQCPNSSTVGFVAIEFAEEPFAYDVPLYNMVAPPGVLAEFGFSFLGYSQNHIRVSLRSGDDYGLTATLANISQAAPVVASSITLWGCSVRAAKNAPEGARPSHC
jgi:hypothetical protein